MPEAIFDATGEPMNEAARQQQATEVARLQIEAAQREAVAVKPDPDTDPDPDAPPPGSWRAEFAEFQSDTATIMFDGEEWEIPAEMPFDYYNARLVGDVGAMIQAIVGLDGMARLRIPTDFPAERLAPMLSEISDAAGKVWGTGNLNRSARRSRGITKR